MFVLLKVNSSSSIQPLKDIFEIPLELTRNPTFFLVGDLGTSSSATAVTLNLEDEPSGPSPAGLPTFRDSS